MNIAHHLIYMPCRVCGEQTAFPHSHCSVPSTEKSKESTAEGALAAMKTIVENFTPPGYTVRENTEP